LPRADQTMHQSASLAPGGGITNGGEGPSLVNHYQFPRLDFASDLWHHVAMNYKRGWVAITVLAALIWAWLCVQANYLAYYLFAPRLDRCRWAKIPWASGAEL
jgi:hypothetical protein